MAAEILSREQRLRKQAELQSLYINLASLREREASYIRASAAIPALIVNQINEVRHGIIATEHELLAFNDDAKVPPAQKYYAQAFEAEQASEYARSVKLYKQAARYDHADADSAIRSVNYQAKITKKRAGNDRAWSPSQVSRPQRRILFALALLLLLTLVLILAFSGRSPAGSEQIAAVEPILTEIVTPAVVKLIIPNTATPPQPLPTSTPTATPLATDTVQPPLNLVQSETISTPTPAPTPTDSLRAAPKLIGPKDGLVWKDGAVVFEFEELNLADNELYCLNTIRGFDINNGENWSYAPTGNKLPFVAVDAHVFRIARIQGMQCLVWSASIGRDSCDNIISKSTAERVIGLPRPCDIK